MLLMIIGPLQMKGTCCTHPSDELDLLAHELYNVIRLLQMKGLMRILLIILHGPFICNNLML